MKLQDVLVRLRLALENLLLFTKWLETVLLLPACLGVLCPDPSVSLFCPPSLDERLEEYNGRWHGKAALDLNESSGLSHAARITAMQSTGRCKWEMVKEPCLDVACATRVAKRSASWLPKAGNPTPPGAASSH